MKKTYPARHGTTDPGGGRPGTAETSFEKDLKQAVDYLDGLSGFEKRRDLLLAWLHDRHDDELRVGVVGITSSGKSTFINALMGEELLPEESRATTNLLVHCRHGDTRQMKVHFRDGRTDVLEGARLHADHVASLCSEFRNPDNRKNVDLLEWTSPRAVVPAGLVLVDTPGLDAFGFKEHEDITLRRFLPLADVVIFMTSIRNPFKKADLELVQHIIENDQRVLFVLSQKDLEVDSHEGGCLYRSRGQRLANHHRRLKSDIRRHTKLDPEDTVLVSSYEAKLAEGDQNAQSWRTSGFEGVVCILERFRGNLSEMVAESRRRKAASRIRGCIQDLERLLADPSSTKATKAAEEKKQREVETLKAAIDCSRTMVTESRQTWAKRLDTSEAMARLHEMLNIRGQDDFIKAGEAFVSEWSEQGSALYRDLDAVREKLDSQFKIFGLSKPSRKELVNQLEVPAFPDVREFQSFHSRKVKTRDWFDSWAFWPKYEPRTTRTVDRDGFVTTLELPVSRTCQLLRTHLEWWSSYVEKAYLAQIESEHKTEQQLLQERKDQRLSSERERRQAEQALAAFRALATGASPLSSTQETRVDSGTAATEEEKCLKARSQRTRAGLPGLLAMFWELEIQKDFRRIVLAKGNGIRSTVLLLGQNWGDNLRILAALAHDLSLVDRLREVASPGSWILTGSLNGLSVKGNKHQLEGVKGLAEQLTIAVAPADCHVHDEHWDRLLQNFDVVGVQLDASRISSGLSDLQCAPYFRHLLDIADSKLFFTCCNGALFNDKLHHLYTQVRVDDLEPRLGQCPWFVCEDYDSRYTSFRELLAHILGQTGTADGLVRCWKQERLSFAAPFSDEQLKAAFEDAKAELEIREGNHGEQSAFA